jgi:hypothetical protein
VVRQSAECSYFHIYFVLPQLQENISQLATLFVNVDVSGLKWYKAEPGELSGIELGYGLDDVVRVSVAAGNFSPHHCIQTDSGVHQASYPMGTRVFLPGNKAAGT